VRSGRAETLALLALAAFGAGSFAFVLGWQSYEAAAKSAAVAVALTGGDPSRAPALITRYGCGGCHAVPGVPGADGKVGPPLAALRERVYVGGVARNTGPTLIRWIVAPDELSPRTAMPRTGISEAEARDVAAFLYAR